MWHLCATITITSSFVLRLECFIENIGLQIMLLWQGSDNIELFMGMQVPDLLGNIKTHFHSINYLSGMKR